MPFLSGIGLACSGEYVDAGRVLYGLSWYECSILGRQEPMPASDSNRPFLVAVSSHWVSLTGLALSLTALISWMFVLPVHVRGHVDNPYIGVLVFVMIPAIFFAGLGLVPLGIFLGWRRMKKGSETIHYRPEAGPSPVGHLAGLGNPSERDRRHAVHLSSRGAHGIGSVLRADLSRDEAGVFGFPELSPFATAVRGLPRGAGRRGLAGQ